MTYPIINLHLLFSDVEFIMGIKKKAQVTVELVLTLHVTWKVCTCTVSISAFNGGAPLEPAQQPTLRL